VLVARRPSPVAPKTELDGGINSSQQIPQICGEARSLEMAVRGRVA
jgi:hypothetical protein